MPEAECAYLLVNKTSIFHLGSGRPVPRGGAKLEIVMTSSNAAPFLAARDFLLRHREDYAKAYRDFQWPKLDRFNWALDYFDVMARGNVAPALWLVDEDAGETKLSFAQLSER